MNTMSKIDHFDIVSGLPASSARLRMERWPLALQRTVARFEGLLQKRRSRRALLRLEDHHLDDIGITRQQALEEARKGFFE